MNDYIIALLLIYIVIGFGFVAIYAYDSSFQYSGFEIPVITFGWLPIILSAFILWIGFILFDNDLDQDGDD